MDESEYAENVRHLNTDKYQFCVGVGSSVYDANIPDEYSASFMRLMPHVIQLDIDDMDTNPLTTELTESLPNGVYIALRNGQTSWNVTSLNLHTFRDVCVHKSLIGRDDPQHLKIGIQRGYWILRTSAKKGRSRPQLESVCRVEHEDGANLDELTYSEPHMVLYDSLYSDWDIEGVMPTGTYFNGAIKHEKYVTGDV